MTAALVNMTASRTNPKRNLAYRRLIFCTLVMVAALLFLILSADSKFPNSIIAQPYESNGPARLSPTQPTLQGALRRELISSTTSLSNSLHLRPILNRLQTPYLPEASGHILGAPREVPGRLRGGDVWNTSSQTYFGTSIKGK